MADDKTLVMAEELCRNNKFISSQETGRIYRYEDGYYKTVTTTKVDAPLHRLIYASEKGRSLSPSKRLDVIRNIIAITAVPEDEINQEGVFNFEDYNYDINSRTKINHSPEYKITVRIPYRIESRLDAPLWNKFLDEVTEGNACKKSLLQEFAGYCLMRSCRFEKALFLIGSGSNGKSVFTETLSKVFGRHNISSVSLESLSNPVLRCNILGKFINIDSDLPRNAERFEETFRKISSGEPVLFNEKFLPAYTTAPTCKLIYCLNEFPNIDDPSNAFYRRMILVPFDVEFNEENGRDTELKDKLETELAGIFHWVVQGYHRLKKNGFTHNEEMKKEIYEIKVDNNPILAFAHEELIFSKLHNGITKRALYAKYVEWTKDHGHKPMAFRKFNNRFYSAFRKKTEKDKQLATMGREVYWPYVTYKNKQENLLNGLVSSGDISFEKESVFAE